MQCNVWLFSSFKVLFKTAQNYGKTKGNEVLSVEVMPHTLGNVFQSLLFT